MYFRIKLISDVSARVSTRMCMLSLTMACGACQMQPFRKETCGSGHVYPLALVSGSSGVRGQGALEASAGKSGVEWSAVRQKTYTYT